MCVCGFVFVCASAHVCLHMFVLNVCTHGGHVCVFVCVCADVGVSMCVCACVCLHSWAVTIALFAPSHF